MTNSSGKLMKLLMTVVAAGVFVVIGIFGYKIFSEKANNSRAVSELKEIQEVMLTDLVAADGSQDKIVDCDGVVFKYEMSKGKVVYSGSLNTDDNGATFTSEIKSKINEMDVFEGSFNMEDGVIIYISKNGKGKAKWVSGKIPSSY